MSLSNITTALNGVSNVLVAVPQLISQIRGGGYQPEPQPQQSIFANIFSGNPALLFHYEGEQTATIESDITDHFTEDNLAVQDQIALRPEMVTTHGFIGELNDVLPPTLQALKLIANRLILIQGFAPSLSVSALEQFNEAVQLYQTTQNTITATIAAFNSVNNQDTIIGSDGIGGGFNPANLGNLNQLVNTSGQTKQQQYFTQFYGYWRSRTLFTVYTPWAYFQHMAIKSLRAVQDADTRTITNFEITFKMIRFADSQSSLASFSGSRLLSQAAAGNPVQAGVTNPQNTTTTLASQVA